MSSRRTTRDEDARLLEISRRTLIAGTLAVAFPTTRSVLPDPVPSVAADEGVHRVKQWLALDHKIERLQDRWARLENWLVREHAWFELSVAEQRSLPWSRELNDIDGAIETLVERRDDLLAALPAVRRPSLESVLLRLAVAERLIWPDVHPEAHSPDRRCAAGPRRHVGCNDVGALRAVAKEAVAAKALFRGDGGRWTRLRPHLTFRYGGAWVAAKTVAP